MNNVFLSMLLICDRLSVKTTMVTASPHNQLDIPLAFSMLLAMPSTVLCLSTMMFYWGMYNMVWWHWMPFST